MIIDTNLHRHVTRSRSGRTVATAVVLIAVVAVAAILSMFFGGGGKGDGTGEGQDSAANQGNAAVRDADARTASESLPAAALAPETQAPQRPLKVTIRGSTYSVDGREMDLAAVKDLALTVPEGAGPAVVIEPDPSARAKAEEELKQSLGDSKIRFAIEE